MQLARSPSRWDVDASLPRRTAGDRLAQDESLALSEEERIISGWRPRRRVAVSRRFSSLTIRQAHLCTRLNRTRSLYTWCLVVLGRRGGWEGCTIAPIVS